ncbi:MAG TPA: NAD(P)H-binding protein [Candidatus Acidoferrum sp.]|nr:NAD(P)H-binding protein [Candidatus Acidoferrum sp.]
MAEKRDIFVTGSTGFMGSALSTLLAGRGHRVRALVRRGSEKKAPAGCEVVLGVPTEASTFAPAVAGADTFVQLVGVAHPNPSKAAEFREIDLVAANAGLDAAISAGVKHFVYVSVAQPAPVMKAYIAVRADAEEAIRMSGLNATFIRPWYVLGPGRRWPLMLLPMYWILGAIPSTRESAQRLGLVSREQMISALAWSAENPSTGVRILDVPAIRRTKLDH